ncbi:hypothetical protein [Nocardiopsis sp. JB363]|uniref:flavodoxin family protein n=1 Tax=Nocardiopsis sp. JB363 TaxID=1434837 RepID=UPI00097A141D|nr:hypothetical protein [Nocardiopsis sp. JB363]SIO85525.1 hypothetical protein BQ8420_07390 [Nocardiopsis sp. JB363]
MRTLIVVESYFGNTTEVARTLAEHLEPARVVPVAEAPTEIPIDVDLLLVGAPTHDFSLPSANTRKQALDKGGHGQGPGVREWIASLTPRDLPVHTFDTSHAKRLSGSAARAAAKALKRRGFRPTRGPSFHVHGRSGPLEEGQLRRVQEWAAALVDGHRP